MAYSDYPGSPDYEHKETPGLAPPGEDELGLLEQFISGIGNDPRFADLFGRASDAEIPGGGFSFLKEGGYIPGVKQIGQFLGGAGRRAEAYRKDASRKLYRGGKTALQDIQRVGGGKGTLGSTVEGMTELGTISPFLEAHGGILANEAAMREQDLMGRLGLVTEGLGTVGNLASYEQMNALQGQQNLTSLAQLAANVGGQSQDELLKALGITAGYRREPYEAHMDQWAPLQRPGGNKLMDLLGAIGGGIAGHQISTYG